VAKGRFHLTLPERLSEEPVIHTLGDRFGLVTTIRRAHIEEHTAWIMLELDGSEEHMGQALTWMSDQGIQVERIEDSG
jgi:ABC-type methionine transport system ATPase subunit